MHSNLLAHLMLLFYCHMGLISSWCFWPLWYEFLRVLISLQTPRDWFWMFGEFNDHFYVWWRRKRLYWIPSCPWRVRCLSGVLSLDSFNLFSAILIYCSETSFWYSRQTWLDFVVSLLVNCYPTDSLPSHTFRVFRLVPSALCLCKCKLSVCMK